MRLKIYTAAPITGKTPDEVIEYFEGTRDRLTDMGFDVLQPMTAKGYFRTDDAAKVPFVNNGYTNPVSTNHAIFERDMWMVDLCDVGYFNFADTTKPSIGMIVELSRAAALGKHTVCVIPHGNSHEHAFIFEAADIRFETEEDAIAYLAKLAQQEM